MNIYTDNYQSIKDYQDMYHRENRTPQENNAQDFAVSLVLSCAILVIVLMSVIFAGPTRHSEHNTDSHDVGVSQTPQPDDVSH